MTELRHSRDITRFNRKRYIMKRMKSRLYDSYIYWGNIPAVNWLSKNRLVSWQQREKKNELDWNKRPRVKKVTEWEDE